jgi:ABC-2 type transport system permease protein
VPIHDQGYRRYAGHRQPPGYAWWVIAKNHIVPALRVRRFAGLLLFAWLPFVIDAGKLYFASNFSQAAMLAAKPETFKEFLATQQIFLFFVTIAMAGLIADDRRVNALQVYLSRPLARSEYITGKLVAALIFLLGVTWLPAMLLLLVQILFAGNFTFVGKNLYLFPAITLFALIQVFTFAFTMLALSSMSKSRRFVSIMYAGIIFFTAAMYQALRAMTGSSAFAWLSPRDSLDIIGNAIFRTAASPAVPVWAAFLSIAVLIAASILILERRVRGVEVVT